MYSRVFIGRFVFCCFQAEDGIRDLLRSRGLGDVYKRQALTAAWEQASDAQVAGQVAGLLATLSANSGRGTEAIGWAGAALERASQGGAELGNAFVMLASGWALDGELERGLSEVDRWLAQLETQPGHEDALLARGPVSYTHLTLPTSDLV